MITNYLNRYKTSKKLMKICGNLHLRGIFIGIVINIAKNYIICILAEQKHGKQKEFI